MHFTASEVALFVGSRLLAGKLRTGQYLLKSKAELTREDKATLTRFDSAVTQVLETKMFTTAMASRLSTLLTKVEALFEGEDMSTRLWFVGMRTCLPELSNEIDEELEAKSHLDSTEPFTRRVEGVPRETDTQRRRRKERNRQREDDENEDEGDEPHL